MNIKLIWGLFQGTFQARQEDKATELAAVLAYYTVFSITPLLIIAIAIFSSIFGQEVPREEIVDQLKEVVGIQSAETIQTGIMSANQPRFGSR
jgi:membrane protein